MIPDEERFCSFETFDQEPTSGVYRATFDRNEVTASTAVLGVISTIEGCDPRELDQLYGVVDPDALDAILGADNRNDAGNISITFPYHGYTITASNLGVITAES